MEFDIKNSFDFFWSSCIIMKNHNNNNNNKNPNVFLII